MILPQVHLVASNLEALHCPHTACAAEYYPSSYELSFSKRIPLTGRLSARTDYILSQRGIKLHTSPRKPSIGPRNTARIALSENYPFDHKHRSTMSEATFTAPVRSMSQAQYSDWFWTWLQDTLLTCRTYGLSANHAAFVRANRHLKPEHWQQLRNRQWPPAGIPLFAHFAPSSPREQQGGAYIQIRPGGATAPKRRLHRLACATIEDRLSQFLQDSKLEASHRLITFTGMERDFNANNLVPENGELRCCAWGGISTHV